MKVTLRIRRPSMRWPQLAVLASIAPLTSCDNRDQPVSVPPEPITYSEAHTYIPPPPPPPPPAPAVAQFSLIISLDVSQSPSRIIERYDPVSGRYLRYRETPNATLEQAPALATGVSLVREDGTVVQLVDRADRRPEMTYDAGRGVYRFTIQYELQTLNDIIGKPLAEADRFVGLRTNFAPVLAVHGLQSRGISKVTLRVNDIDAATTAPDGNSAQDEIPLSSDFQLVSSRVAT